MQNRSARLLKIGGLYNKIRVAQGWNILGPKETLPIAEIWDEQLERKGVPDDVFNDLFNRATDRRLDALAKGTRPPDFSIELILAMYQEYLNEHYPRESDWDRYKRMYG